MKFPRLPAALVAVAAAVALSGCAPTIALPTAPNAGDPRCADLTVSMRTVPVLGGFDRVWTDAQSTAAWGDPTAIIMSCGVDPVAASTFPCETVGGLDWVIDNSDPDYYRMTTFGRDPAVQLFIDLKALREHQLEASASKDGDPASVVSRITRYMTDFQKTGACTDRPAS